MKLYIYQGLDTEHEHVPKDVTHVTVDASVTIIKWGAFQNLDYLESVSLGDNVMRIESHAFFSCTALRFVRLSKTLEYIGECAFFGCYSLEALFIPLTVKSIHLRAFSFCELLRLVILPHDIDISNVFDMIIFDTGIHRIAESMGVHYENDDNDPWQERSLDESSWSQVNDWLIHHMDESPFHKLCYNSSITTKLINDYLNENGNESALAIDNIHGMTPLHMLTMNPYAPGESIGALLDDNMEVTFCLDNQGKTSLDYARDNNVGGLVTMITGLCIHRYAA